MTMKTDLETFSFLFCNLLCARIDFPNFHYPLVSLKHLDHVDRSFTQRVFIIHTRKKYFPSGHFCIVWKFFFFFSCFSFFYFANSLEEIFFSLFYENWESLKIILWAIFFLMSQIVHHVESVTAMTNESSLKLNNDNNLWNNSKRFQKAYANLK